MPAGQAGVQECPRGRTDGRRTHFLARGFLALADGIWRPRSCESWPCWAAGRLLVKRVYHTLSRGGQKTTAAAHGLHGVLWMTFPNRFGAAVLGFR